MSQISFIEPVKFIDFETRLFKILHFQKSLWIFLMIDKSILYWRMKDWLEDFVWVIERLTLCYNVTNWLLGGKFHCSTNAPSLLLNFHPSENALQQSGTSYLDHPHLFLLELLSSYYPTLILEYDHHLSIWSSPTSSRNWHRMINLQTQILHTITLIFTWEKEINLILL